MEGRLVLAVSTPILLEYEEVICRGVRPCWLTANRYTLRLIMPAVLLIIFLIITPVPFVWLRRGELFPAA